MRVKGIVPLQPGAYRQLLRGKDKVYDWPVVALAVLDDTDGPRFSAVVADWEEGFTLIDDLDNAIGVCEFHEVGEAIRKLGR